jgi:pullulanase/glycogen debranching enzyme
VNFAVFSENAEAVEICLLDAGVRETALDSGSRWKPAYPWKDKKRPRVHWDETVIYEARQGLTAMNPNVPKPLSGTFAGLVHPSVIEHLVKLGATAIELLPVPALFDDRYLVDRRLKNYWGYNYNRLLRAGATLDLRRW